MVVLTIVTDAVRPMARPTKVVCALCPAVEIVTLAGAMMVPTIELRSSMRAALPTCQKTLRACAPLISNTRRGVALRPTVSAAAHLEHPHRVGVALRVERQVARGDGEGAAGRGVDGRWQHQPAKLAGAGVAAGRQRGQRVVGCLRIGTRLGGDGRRTQEAAPRERGWTLQRAVRVELERGCPARAGMDPSAALKNWDAFWLPPASGDGPEMLADSSALNSAAPRERGWTQRVRPRTGPPLGCPARAGMDPGPENHQGSYPRLPRASGDGPIDHHNTAWPTKAAPRERGWTLRTPQIDREPDGCPARAGMDPPSSRRPPSCIWLPRASGDGPPTDFGDLVRGLAAPRERGWTPSFQALDDLAARKGDYQCAGLSTGFLRVGTRGGICALASSSSRMCFRVQ